MSANRTKKVRAGCAVGLLFVLAAAIILFIRYQATTSCHENSPLLKSLGLTLDPSQEEQFIEQARKFAFKNSFRFDTGYIALKETNVRIRMIRKDVEVIVSSPLNTAGFEVDFYSYDCVHPTSASEVEELVADFKSFMSKIPTVIIRE